MYIFRNEFKIKKKERIEYYDQNGQLIWYIYYNLKEANGDEEYIYCVDESPLNTYRVNQFLATDDLSGLHRSANGRLFFDSKIKHRISDISHCYRKPEVLLPPPPRTKW